jgi:hypothetical protein
MKDTTRTEDWRSLCEQASRESDPEKLLELISQINRALDETQPRRRTDEASLRVDTVLLPINKSGEYEYDLFRFPEESCMALDYDC